MKNKEQCSFARKLKNYRLGRGMSRKMLAQATQTSIGNIDLLESGVLLPSPALTESIAAALKIDRKQIRYSGRKPELTCASLKEVFGS